ALDMLLHDAAKLSDDILLEFEEIESVMPAAEIRSAGGIAVVLHEPVCQLFKRRIQMDWAVLAAVNPGGEQRYYPDLNGLILARASRSTRLCLGCCRHISF